MVNSPKSNSIRQKPLNSFNPNSKQSITEIVNYVAGDDVPDVAAGRISGDEFAPVPPANPSGEDYQTLSNSSRQSRPSSGRKFKPISIPKVSIKRRESNAAISSEDEDRVDAQQQDSESSSPNNRHFYAQQEPGPIASVGPNQIRKQSTYTEGQDYDLSSPEEYSSSSSSNNNYNAFETEPDPVEREIRVSGALKFTTPSSKPSKKLPYSSGGKGQAFAAVSTIASIGTFSAFHTTFSSIKNNGASANNPVHKKPFIFESSKLEMLTGGNQLLNFVPQSGSITDRSSLRISTNNNNSNNNNNNSNYNSANNGSSSSSSSNSSLGTGKSIPLSDITPQNEFSKLSPAERKQVILDMIYRDKNKKKPGIPSNSNISNILSSSNPTIVMSTKSNN